MSVWAASLGALDSPLIQPLIFKALHLPTNAFTSLLYGLAIAAGIFLPSVMLIAMLGVWWERKVSARIQSRIGPNRVGFIGLMQSLADGIKMLTKEDLTPAQADKLLFKLAPYLAFPPVLAAFSVLPFAPNLVFEPALSIGLFWILAILSVEVMGVILAGWASNNKWSVYGAMREACQIVSYEIPLGLSVLVAVMSAGTLNLIDISLLQGGGLQSWLIFRNPFIFIAYITFFIASLASNKRAPFDLPESDSELVAGYHTEYSGLRFGFFFLADYAAMFIVGGIQAALFLGGWNDPFGLLGWAFQRFGDGSHTAILLGLNALGAGIFIGKAILVIFIQMWLRWTLPRPRIDQVLYACVQVLLPACCCLLLGAAVWQLFLPEMTGVPWRDYQPFRWADYAAGHATAATVCQIVLALGGVGLMLAIFFWIVHAALSGRSIRPRLSEAAPLFIPSPGQA